MWWKQKAAKTQGRNAIKPKGLFFQSFKQVTFLSSMQILDCATASPFQEVRKFHLRLMMKEAHSASLFNAIVSLTSSFYKEEFRWYQKHPQLPDYWECLYLYWMRFDTMESSLESLSLWQWSWEVYYSQNVLCCYGWRCACQKCTAYGSKAAWVLPSRCLRHSLIWEKKCVTSHTFPFG